MAMTTEIPVSDSLDRVDVQRRMIEIVSRVTGRPENRIGPDTALILDLGVAGDDADRLFLEITKTYPIDFAGSDLYARFGSEGFWPSLKGLKNALQGLVSKRQPGERPQRDVLVSDVVDWAMAGRWTPRE